MTRDKDRNQGDEATESGDSPAESDTVPESARPIPVAPRRPLRGGSDLGKLGPPKVRYLN